MKKELTTSPEIIQGAMDQHAMRIAISFAEFTAQNLWTVHNGRWFEYRNEDNPISGEQLYNLFVQDILKQKTSHVD